MKYIFLKLIHLYQKTLSSVLRHLSPNCGCRFHPTCSEYSYQAIKQYGILRGSFKGLKRILRCHPFNKGGYDPI